MIKILNAVAPKFSVRKCRLYGMVFEFMAMDVAKFRYASIDDDGDLIIRYQKPEVLDCLGYWHVDDEAGQIISNVSISGDWEASLTKIEWVE